MGHVVYRKHKTCDKGENQSGAADTGTRHNESPAQRSKIAFRLYIGTGKLAIKKKARQLRTISKNNYEGIFKIS